MSRARFRSIGLVAKAHQNLTFTTPPNLQRAVAVGLAKPDAYFASLAARPAGNAADLLDAGLQELGFRTLPADGSYFITADFSPLGFTGDDAEFCRTITEHARRRRDPGLGLLRDDPPAPLRPLRLLQAARSAAGGPCAA